MGDRPQKARGTLTELTESQTGMLDQVKFPPATSAGTSGKLMKYTAHAHEAERSIEVRFAQPSPMAEPQAILRAHSWNRGQGTVR
jgi:hypothetical protein